MASFRGYDKLTDELVKKAERLENLLDTNGLNVTSGFRSPARNKAVGGWSKSWHLKGMALDIGRSSFKENPQELYTKAKMAGFGGVIIYDTHVHVDIGPNYFDDKRTGNGPYDSNFVKVNTAKVDIKNIDVNQAVDQILGNTKSIETGVDEMSTPLMIGLLVLAVIKLGTSFFE